MINVQRHWKLLLGLRWVAVDEEKKVGLAISKKREWLRRKLKPVKIVVNVTHGQASGKEVENNPSRWISVGENEH